MDEPRWLDGDQQRAWRKLAAVITKLPAALDAQLQRDAGLTHFEYWVLALLSETPSRALRMSHLAASANASSSRLSHVVSRLEARGWLSREPCPDDRRSMFAVLNDDGYAKVVASAPGHVAAVRSLVFDGLSPAQVDQLDSVCAAVLAVVEREPASRA